MFVQSSLVLCASAKDTAQGLAKMEAEQVVASMATLRAFFLNPMQKQGQVAPPPPLHGTPGVQKEVNPVGAPPAGPAGVVHHAVGGGRHPAAGGRRGVPAAGRVAAAGPHFQRAAGAAPLRTVPRLEDVLLLEGLHPVCGCQRQLQSN